MTWTQSELDALKKAYASGTLRVSYDGRTVEFGSEADLIRTLEQTALPAWKTRIDALSQQFARATMAAATLLEPKTQRVHLTSGTLTAEQEVKAWLTETETDLLAKLKKGPIVIN